MPTIDCKASDVGRLIREFEARAQQAVRDAQEPAAKAGLEIVLTDIPRVTGALAASGHVVPVREGGEPGADLKFGGERAPYAGFVEVGTEHQDPRWFVGGHLPEMADALAPIIEDAMNKGG